MPWHLGVLSALGKEQQLVVSSVGPQFLRTDSLLVGGPLRDRGHDHRFANGHGGVGRAYSNGGQGGSWWDHTEGCARVT